MLRPLGSRAGRGSSEEAETAMRADNSTRSRMCIAEDRGRGGGVRAGAGAGVGGLRLRAGRRNSLSAATPQTPRGQRLWGGPRVEMGQSKASAIPQDLK